MVAAHGLEPDLQVHSLPCFPLHQAAMWPVAGPKEEIPMIYRQDLSCFFLIHAIKQQIRYGRTRPLYPARRSSLA